MTQVKRATNNYLLSIVRLVIQSNNEDFTSLVRVKPKVEFRSL